MLSIHFLFCFLQKKVKKKKVKHIIIFAYDTKLQLLTWIPEQKKKVLVIDCNAQLTSDFSEAPSAPAHIYNVISSF